MMINGYIIKIPTDVKKLFSDRQKSLEVGFACLMQIQSSIGGKGGDQRIEFRDVGPVVIIIYPMLSFSISLFPPNALWPVISFLRSNQ